MYCRQCGFNNDKYSKMCKRCGSDLTRPVGEYNPAPSEPGKLRHAPKQETFVDWFKRRFRRLERAALDKSHRRPFIIAGACILAAVLAFVVVPRIISCFEVVPDRYGTTAGNTATFCPVAVNGDYLYCSQPVGDNPGLYRVKLSTGEPLKLSWHTLEQVTWYEGWLYGIDETGALVRMTYDGLDEQRVIDELNVRYVTFFNDHVYYIGGQGAVYRAPLSEISSETTAQPQLVLDSMVSEMVIFDGMIYYIEYMGMGYEPNVPLDSIIDPEWEPGKISWITGKPTVPDYRVDAAVPGKPMGNVCRMNPDGSGQELVIGGMLCNLSAHGEYIYYMTQTEVEVSASRFDPGAPGTIMIRASSSQFWRFNLMTSKYTRFLAEGTARSALNVTDAGICFVSINGDLEKCPTVGGDHVLLPTEAVNVQAYAVINNVVYYTSNNGQRVGWINIDGSAPHSLWEAQWGAVVFPTVSLSDAVSPADTPAE